MTNAKDKTMKLEMMNEQVARELSERLMKSTTRELQDEIDRLVEDIIDCDPMRALLTLCAVALKVETNEERIQVLGTLSLLYQMNRVRAYLWKYKYEQPTKRNK